MARVEVLTSKQNATKASRSYVLWLRDRHLGTKSKKPNSVGRKSAYVEDVCLGNLVENNILAQPLECRRPFQGKSATQAFQHFTGSVVQHERVSISDILSFNVIGRPEISLHFATLSVTRTAQPCSTAAFPPEKDEPLWLVDFIFEEWNGEPTGLKTAGTKRVEKGWDVSHRSLKVRFCLGF